MGLPEEIEDRITQFATRCFSRGEIGARNSDPSRERDALVSAITHALAERDARIAELEAALRPFSACTATVIDVQRARALVKGGTK